MIYFLVKDEEFVKIGYSDDPDKRRSQLQTASPEPLRIICTVSGTRKQEKELHSYFYPLKTILGGSEWFKLSTGLQMYIRRLTDLGTYEPPNQIERLCLPKK